MSEDAKSSNLPFDAVLREIVWLLNFPYPQVCRHLVAGRLLDAMEMHGYPLSAELAGAVACAKDDEALRILETAQ